MTKKRKADDHEVESPEPVGPLSKRQKLELIRQKVANGYAKDDKKRLEAKRLETAKSNSTSATAAVVAPPSMEKTKVGNGEKKSRAQVRAAAQAYIETQGTPLKSPAKKSPISRKKATAAPLVAMPSPAVQQPMSLPFAAQYTSQFGGMMPLSPQMQLSGMTLEQQQQAAFYAIRRQQAEAINMNHHALYGGGYGHAPSGYGLPANQFSIATKAIGNAAPQFVTIAPAPQQTRKKTTSTRKSRTPKKTTVSKKKEDDDDDEFPTPPSLETQISIQVLENAAADLQNKQPPHTQPPPEAAEQAEDDCSEIEESTQDVDEQPLATDGVDDGSEKRFKKALYGSALAAVAAALCIAIEPFSEQRGYESSSSGSATPPKIGEEAKKTCFISSSEDPQFCDNADEDNISPCPPNAVCAFGEITTCLSPFDVATANDCVVSGQTLEMLEVLTSELATQSKNHETCDALNRPILKYSDLWELRPDVLVEESRDLIELLQSKDFILRRDDDQLFVGLPANHPTNTLPLYCHVANISRQSLNTVGTMLLASAVTFTSQSWNLTKAYPLYSIIGLIVVSLCWKWRSSRARKAKLIVDIANVREMAYDKLVDFPGQAHTATHIRDEIALKLYPKSKSERKYVVEAVWPRVVSDIKRDTRVKKSVIWIGGEQRDQWQWMAAPPSGKTARFVVNAN